MKKRNSLILVLLLSIPMFLGACSDKENQANKKEKIIQENKLENTEETKEKEPEEPAVEEKEELPEESQAVSKFLWEEDEDFINAQKEHGADVLIAGFSTVFDGATPEEFENIKLASSLINGTVVQPGEVFSQNETAGPYTEERGYKEGSGYVGGEIVKDFGGGVCKVATTLYNTSIASDIGIVERHNHSMPVGYVPYGQDAAVAYGYKDFKFENTTDHSMLIWTKLEDNRLYMAFYGKEKGPEVAWEHETLSETAASTRYENNPELDEGEEKVIVNGMDGKVVNSVLKITDENGEEKIKEVGKSSYNPMMHIIERNQ